ncbi:MAG: sigma-70 family RNA polymerase sigma factor, partial [Actinobacteria bacterium]|nr:sigma-70 family RNA polymerase sigma factor [Actinomycetota bacterium]
DHHALMVLYHRYGRSAFALARRICGDDSLAEDAVQEAMLQLRQRASTFDASRGTVATWLFAVVHHRAVAVVRRHTTLRHRPPPLSVEELERAVSPGPEPDQVALHAEFGQQAREALWRLPHDERQTLVLCYFGGYTQAEVAATLGVPLGTIKSRCYDSISRLREWLAPLGYPDG